MSEVTEEEFIDIGSRMAQELQELVDDAIKSSGEEDSLPGVRELIDEWEAVYKRSGLGLVGQLLKQVDSWNKNHDVGVKVVVTKDDGEVETITRSEAWVLGDHSAVVMVKGISGAYALERVKAL